MFLSALVWIFGPITIMHSNTGTLMVVIID